MWGSNDGRREKKIKGKRDEKEEMREEREEMSMGFTCHVST